MSESERSSDPSTRREGFADAVEFRNGPAGTDPDAENDPVSEDRGGRRPRRRREKLFAMLPTLLTLGNAVCGFAAITYAAKLGPDDVQADGTHLLVAALYIYFAMLFDMLDGRVARWANQQSEFGAQLDSLCDAISFGLAPAFLMLQFSAHSVFHRRLLWAIAALYAACALLRLARFNVETDEEGSHDWFSGLPSPAAAGVVASFPVAMYGLVRLLTPRDPGLSGHLLDLAGWLKNVIPHLLPPVTLTVAGLMVSRVRYSHVFNQFFTGRRNRGHVIQVVFAVAVIFVIRELALPLILCTFAFGAPLRSLWRGVLLPRLHRSRS